MTTAVTNVANADPRSGHFRTDIQGLRGVAVLLVVAYHAGLPLTGGFVGVDVFFVVSGLVITRMLAAELADTGRIDLLRFYSRRAKRLLPALALVLSVVMLASVGLGSLESLEPTARTGGAAALVVANMELYRFADREYFDHRSHMNPLLHTWSLSVEEQFYLFFPTLLGIGWRLRPRAGWLGQGSLVPILVAIVSCASFGLSALMTLSHERFLVTDPRMFSFYSAPTRAWEFGLGVLAALIIRSDFTGGSARVASAVVGWLLIGWPAFTYSAQTRFPGMAAIPPAVGAVLLLAAGGSPGAAPWPVRCLENKLLVRIGDLSYSWYLWHWPFIVFGRTLFPDRAWVPSAMALLSLGPAWASYVALEGPVRRWRSHSSRQIAALVLACLLVPLLSALALKAANHSLSRVDSIASYRNAMRLHLDGTQGCGVSAATGAAGGSPCFWPTPDSRGRVLLIGDSNAGHFAEPVVVAARSLGLSVEIATFPGCPFVDLVDRSSNGAEERECRRFYEASLARIVAKPPDLVIAASASDSHIGCEGCAAGAADWQQGAAQKGAVWAKGLEATLRSIRFTGSKVLVVHPIPRLQDWQGCAVLVVALWPDGCGVSRSLDSALQQRSIALFAERLASSATGALTMDPSETICPDSTCRSRRDGLWWYRDAGHLTVDGSLALVPRFRESIMAALSLE